MRRTRHVALPVRAWQYVGLLVVSLACLTVGLVSRDKEGHAGSLAGPELEHRAPHEVDACPNLSPFAKMPSCLNTKQNRIGTTTAQETGDSRTTRAPADLRVSRSRSLDRASRSRLHYRTDLRSTEEMGRQERNVRADPSRRIVESTPGSRSLYRTRRQSVSEIRLTRSRSADDLGPRRTIRISTDSDRRRETNRRMNEAREREAVRRSTERQISADARREKADDRLNRMRVASRRDSRSDQDRRSLSRIDQRDLTGGRRERNNRQDRRANVRANELRVSSLRLLKRSTDLDRRERTDRLNLARGNRELRTVRTLDLSRNDLNQRRVRDSSRDRRSEPRTVESRRILERRSVEFRDSEEVRAERGIVEQRVDRGLSERRMDRVRMDQRAHGHLGERRMNERIREQRNNRRIIVQQRSNRRLVERLLDRRNTEHRIDRRLEERRTDRRSMDREDRVDQRRDQRVMVRRIDRRAAEQRADRQKLDSRRSLERTLDRIQRTRAATTLSENNIRHNEIEKRLTNRAQTQQLGFRDRIMNDARRSRLSNRENIPTIRLSPNKSVHRKLLENSTTIRENLRSSQPPSRERRESRIFLDTRSPRIRDNISNRGKEYTFRMKTWTAKDFLTDENSIMHGTSFEVIRQALVIGLCTVYGLSVFYGKRSFISNFVQQAPRLITW